MWWKHNEGSSLQCFLAILLTEPETQRVTQVTIVDGLYH